MAMKYVIELDFNKKIYSLEILFILNRQQRHFCSNLKKWKKAE